MTLPSQVSGAIRLERDGPFGWIIIDHPEKLNALNAAMWRALPQAVAEAEADDAVRVIILRGAGARAFSAGADISEFEAVRQGDAAREYDALNNAAFASLSGAAKPTIAMVQGFCLGGGLALALNCDLRIAAEDAVFGLPPARLGIGYNPRWIKPLVAVVGATHAKELLFTAERINAATALRLQLVSRVSPPDELETATRAMAQTIAHNAPLTILAAKRAIDAFAADVSWETLTRLDALVEQCFVSEDYEEGCRAFIQKRKAEFKGR